MQLPVGTESQVKQTTLAWKKAERSIDRLIDKITCNYCTITYRSALCLLFLFSISTNMRRLISLFSGLSRPSCFCRRYNAFPSKPAIRALSTFPNHPLFRAIQAHDPDSLAVLHSSSCRSFTYGNLVADVLRSKERLAQTGQASVVGERIAFLAENSYDYVGRYLYLVPRYLSL